MEMSYVRVQDVLGGDVPFLLDSFDQLPGIEQARGRTPEIDALRVVCSELGLPRDFARMCVACAEAAKTLVFDNRGPSGHRPWLFAATAALLPDDRVTRYKKLWKRIDESYGIGTGRRGPEVPFEFAEGLRFAAVVELTPENFAEGTRLLRALRSSALVWTAREQMDSEAGTRRFFELAFPPRKGVPDNRTGWARLASAYCPLGDILVRPSGSWDERECSLDLIGRRDQLRPLEAGLPSVLEEGTGRARH